MSGVSGVRATWPWVLLLAVLALGSGLNWGIPVLVRAGYLLLLLFLFALVYATLSLRLTRVEPRVGATRVVAGDRVLEVYDLRTRALWPVFGIHVITRSGVSRARPRWLLALAPCGHDELSSVAVATARGRYAVGAVTLAVGDPFGVCVARRKVPPVGEVIVWPLPRMVPEFSPSDARAGDLLPARRSWARMPVAGAVRPFVPGDPSTRIHWLSSIRHGFLMVKESDYSVGQRLWVALDLSSPAHAGIGEDSTVEYAVEAAAYVLELAYKTGLDIGIVACGETVEIAEPRRGHGQREHLLDLLAVVRAGRGPDLAATLDEGRLIRPSDAVVVLTPAVPDRLLDLATRLSRLGCGVAAVVLDAASFGGRDTLADRSVVALEEERIPVYRLGRMGV